MAQGLPLLNFLIEERKWVVHVRGLLLVERRHTERLVHGDVLATRGPVAIMSVVTETSLVQITQVGHDSVDATKETLILLNHEELVAAAAQARDRFAQVLRQNLERSIRLLTADEDLANYRIIIVSLVLCQ